MEPNFHGGRREGNVEEETPGKGAEPKLGGTKVEGHGGVVGWERRGTEAHGGRDGEDTEAPYWWGW